MKQIILFLLLIGFVLVLMGYLEMFFDSKQIEKKIEYRFIPRDIYDQIESNQIDNQFNFMFDSKDARLNTNLV